MSDSSTPSIWLATSEVQFFPTLSHDIETEVAVVGAGIVGILCAHALTKAGRQVTLLEARRVLHGVTGNTTAKVSVSHGPIYDHLASNFSEGKAQMYAEANLSAQRWIADHARDCDLLWKPLYLYAQDEKAFDDLKIEAEAARQAGLACELREKIDVPFQNSGALVFPNQAEFHPIKFLVPLLNEAIEAGCRVYEGCMVSECEEGDTTELQTLEGVKIRAKQVIIATHFPFFDPGFYYARLDAFRDYAIAAQVGEQCLDGMYVGSGNGYTYRCQPGAQGEYLIISGAKHKVGHQENAQSLYDEMERFARQHFPVKEISYRWSTQDNGTLDQVPYIGKISANAENVYVACGFGGWGMTHGVVAAQLLSALLQGQNPPEAELYDPLRFKPVTSAPELGKIAVDSVKGLVLDRFGGSEKEVEEITPGEGAVVNTKEGKVGAYRDEGGVLHAVSAVCTHMGCILAFNNAEKSWDCPCHGSRFDVAGEVLHGPAVTPLKKIEAAKLSKRYLG